MTNSILEITENEYLIKLNRSNFDLSFIRSLLKIVEVSKPAKSKSDDDSYYYSDAPIADRPNLNHSSEPDYFSSLDEK